MSDFITKDSGQRQVFNSGAQRDTQAGKGRYDLIPPIVEQRYAELLERGAIKYGERNWEIGMPLSRYIDSAKRHLNQLRAGDNSEDHASAVIFNVAAIIHHRDAIAKGLLSAELDDLPKSELESLAGGGVIGGIGSDPRQTSEPWFV